MEMMRVPRIMHNTSVKFCMTGQTVGFVPTMGALHEGHISLVRRSKQENDVTVVSIFVNPTQFGPSEDFERYPRDIEGDTEKLKKEEVDIIFVPEISSIYPEGFLTNVKVKKISEKLCGAFRPGHFSGVATVVTKLLNIVKPTRAYFGLKDFQQYVIIRKLVKDLNMEVEIVGCPIVREQDGLAMSSRNAYLDKSQREAAPVVNRCLTEASELIKSGIINVYYIKEFMHEKLLKEPAVSVIDYAGVYDPDTLDELSEIKGDTLIAVAVRIGETRLIDNMLVESRENPDPDSGNLKNKVSKKKEI
ncbi:MAG: pantoate--beta-alanine ligase [Nitrospirota bacterium]|nr:pantoate--beta-alanine ligase [Nitrospirota bacterium]MDH5767669.1 pantoate--beta-alanine ligase [Nitrospirota bacterium]